MRMLHDPMVRSSIERRLKALRPDAPRQWGSMTQGQMLWHLNQFLEFALGEGSHKRMRSAIPLPIMRLLVLYGPWPKGAPTHPEAVANEARDFDAERARCLALIDRFTNRPIEGPWPVDAAWGKVNGKFASRLQARHLDHHLRQFGA